MKLQRAAPPASTHNELRSKPGIAKNKRKPIKKHAQRTPPPTQLSPAEEPCWPPTAPAPRRLQQLAAHSYCWLATSPAPRRSQATAAQPPCRHNRAALVTCAAAAPRAWSQHLLDARDILRLRPESVHFLAFDPTAPVAQGRRGGHGIDARHVTSSLSSKQDAGARGVGAAGQGSQGGDMARPMRRGSALASGRRCTHYA
jgi:hypothetical protein